MERKRKPMFAVVMAGALLAAFGLGMTGLPGGALMAAVDFMVEHEMVHLEGPVGQAVRGFLG